MIMCELKSILLIIPILCLNYGIYVGMFNEFKDEKGNFKKALVSDVRGMLGLYEAVHLRVNGEDILDEALAFTTTHLRSMVGHLEYHLAEQVAHALKQPIRKGLERLEARRFVYLPGCTTLLKLAKLDFNLVQSLHKEELSNIARFAFKSLADIPSHLLILP